LKVPVTNGSHWLTLAMVAMAMTMTTTMALEMLTRCKVLEGQNGEET
jgi:hypothetical protein